MAEKLPRQYTLNRTSCTAHYDILRGGQNAYYVDQSAFAHKRPDLTFHQGSDNKGPVVAAAYLPSFKTDVKVGLGDPANAHWEEMDTKKHGDTREYYWGMVLDGARRNYVWQRTKTVAVDGRDEPSTMTFRNWTLLDPDTNELLAVFTGDRGWTTCGVLQVNKDLSDKFEMMVVVTCVAMYEKTRRRRNARLSSIHGGGH